MHPLRLLSFLIAIFFVGLVLVSCSATGRVDCEGHFGYDTDAFSPTEKIWIEESGKRWNDWVGHRVISLTPGPLNGDDNLCFIRVGPVLRPASGWTDRSTKLITVDVDYLKSANLYASFIFEGLIMHELGHGIGYRHLGVKDGDALMSPVNGHNFTEIDRAECISIGMCPPALPN